jgi:Transposase DNA-binding/Transposase DDE domain
MTGRRGEFDWGSELGGADFGDARLGKRLLMIAEAVALEPDRSFPSIFGDTALEGAYRFFNNEEVTPARILEPHIQATMARMATEAVALVVHDTSTMTFNPDGARKGLGRVRSTGQAYFAHVSLAISGDGSRTPLGALALSTHIRKGKQKTKKQKKKKQKRGTNERDRWGQQVAAIRALGINRSQVVHLMDREADDFGLLAQLLEAEDRFVIRLAHDRLLTPATPDGAKKLALAVAQTQAIAEREVPLSSRPAGSRSPKQKHIHPTREGRVAKLAMGATKVSLRRPVSQPKTLPATLTLNVVRVWEVDTPKGETPVEWLLVTTEPVDTAEQILQIVDWYRARWVIEEFFKALKTGCAYEKRQLETYEGLVNVLATFMPVAWRLLHMRTRVRIEPDAAGTTVLPAPMIEVLHAFTRIKLAVEPTAREVLLALAALGGHLKHNGEPGWITLGRGYQKLRTLTEGWLAREGLGECQDV